MKEIWERLGITKAEFDAAHEEMPIRVPTDEEMSEEGIDYTLNYAIPNGYENGFGYSHWCQVESAVKDLKALPDSPFREESKQKLLDFAKDFGFSKDVCDARRKAEHVTTKVPEVSVEDDLQQWATDNIMRVQEGFVEGHSFPESFRRVPFEYMPDMCVEAQSVWKNEYNEVMGDKILKEYRSIALEWNKWQDVMREKYMLDDASDGVPLTEDDKVMYETDSVVANKNRDVRKNFLFERIYAYNQRDMSKLPEYVRGNKDVSFEIPKRVFDKIGYDYNVFVSKKEDISLKRQDRGRRDSGHGGMDDKVAVYDADGFSRSDKAVALAEKIFADSSEYQGYGDIGDE